MKIRPTKGNVFVEGIEETHRGLIEIPQTALGRDIPSIGRVVAMGGCRVTKKGVRIPPEFKIGERVIFKKFSGLLCEVDGKTLIQVKIHDVQALLYD